MDQDRQESLKAGLLGGVIMVVAFGLLWVGFTIAPRPWLPDLTDFAKRPLAVEALVKVAIVGFSGGLFGITYRYTVRQDQNLQLKLGATFSFALVRGLAQVDDFAWTIANTIPILATLVENLCLFALTALTIEHFIQRCWIKPCC